MTAQTLLTPTKKPNPKQNNQKTHKSYHWQTLRVKVTVLTL